jgi:hypothetical protein
LAVVFVESNQGKQNEDYKIKEKKPKPHSKNKLLQTQIYVPFVDKPFWSVGSVLLSPLEKVV